MSRLFSTCYSTQGFFIALVLMCGCQQTNPWQSEAETLLKQSSNLEAQYVILNTRIDSLWDATTDVIEKGLPDDFPPVDRDIFLHSRNADHIRMFMSFKTLSPDVQAAVDAAAHYDAMLAAQAKKLQTQRTHFDKQKNQFLMKVAGHDKRASKTYAAKFVAISTPSH